MSKITKFGCGMLQNAANVALQNLQILYMYFCIACGNCYHFRPKCDSNFRTLYKSIQNLRTLQGYIFRILQDFAAKLCSFTNFSMLFLAVVIYLHLLA
jgi:hypothetical protein